MSLSQLTGKPSINYASMCVQLINSRELRTMRSPNDQQSITRNHENLVQRSLHQRAKSTNNHRQGTPITDLEESEKLFDQFFKLNNSKSDSDFMRDSMQRETKSTETDFLKFVDNAIEYHKQSEIMYRPKKHHEPQRYKELAIQNQLLVSKLNKYKQHNIELKTKIKLMNKEYQIEIAQLVQKNEWLEELLIKQKIDNENSLLAVKKSLEMMQGKCKCQKGMIDKMLKDVKTLTRPQFDIQSNSSSSSNTEEEDFNFDYLKRKKSLTKVPDEHQLYASNYAKELFFKKRPIQDPYYT